METIVQQIIQELAKNVLKKGQKIFGDEFYNPDLLAADILKTVLM